jgi:hypothetical protein
MKVVLPAFLQLYSATKPAECALLLEFVLANIVKFINFLQGVLERNSMVKTTSGIQIDCFRLRRMGDLIPNMEFACFFFW